MDIARLLLDYLKVLIWPAVLIFAIVYFRKHINGLFLRLARQSEEISATGFGFEFSAKFREEIADLAARSDAANPDELRESVKRTARQLALDEFRALSAHFFTSPYDVRQRAAFQISTLVTTMSYDDILAFAGSVDAGERVGAGVALGVFLAESADAQENPRTVPTLRALLNDSFSRVRYRAVEAIRHHPMLVAELKDILALLAKSDPTAPVKELAQRVLRDLRE